MDRRIDVFVRGNFAGKIARGTMAVDGKCFSRKVDVKHVEAFIGLVEDVGTDFGLLVTTEGFTVAANHRANVPGMRIDIVPYAELSEWEPPFHFCEVCTDRESGCGVEWKAEVDIDRKGNPLSTDPHEHVEFRSLVEGQREESSPLRTALPRATSSAGGRPVPAPRTRHVLLGTFVVTGVEQNGPDDAKLAT